MKASATKADPGKGSKSAGKDARHDIRSRAGPLNETGPLMDLIQRSNGGGEGPSMQGMAGELASMPLARRQKAVLSLQRIRGNSFVQRLAIQTKLQVGPAGDKYELEADRVADQVMRMTEPANSVQRQEDEEEIHTKPLASSITPLFQRFTSFIASPLQRQEDEEEIQAKRTSAEGSFDAGSSFERSLSVTRGGGRPLPELVRTQMEARFGVDFSGVRIHTGNDATELNKAVDAQAFTHGRDIFLGEGRSNVESNAGKKLIAHELTHVIQQTREIQPYIQRWSLMWTGPVKAAPAGHELLTAASLEEAGLRPYGSTGTIYGSETETWMNKTLKNRKDELTKAIKKLEKIRRKQKKAEANLEKAQVAYAQANGGKSASRANTALKKAQNAWINANQELYDAKRSKEAAQKAYDDQAQYAEFIKGAVWNDDPERLLGGSGAEFGEAFSSGKSAVEKAEEALVKAEGNLEKARKANNREAINAAEEEIKNARDKMKRVRLTGRSHEGDLQFLHGMASSLEETAKVTQRKVMLWAEFCYKVAIGDIPVTTQFKDVDVRPERELESSVSSIRDLFPKQANMTVAQLFGASGEAARYRALGSMLHMLQDTFCASHAERVAAKRKGEIVGRIKSFHAYPAQESSRHARADIIKQVPIKGLKTAQGAAKEALEGTMGAEEAVEAGAGIAKRYRAGIKWDAKWGQLPGPKVYLQQIFALVPQEAAQVGREWRSIGPGKAGPGRSFRKSVHEEYYGMLQTFAPTVRPITYASKVYDNMLLYESNTLSPQMAIKQKTAELEQVRHILKIIADWELRKNRTSETNQKAVEFLKSKMREDQRMIQEEIADIENALRTK